MDIQQIIESVTAQAEGAPEVLQGLVADSAATVEGSTGEHLDVQGLSDVVSGVVSQVQQGGFDVASIREGTNVSETMSEVLQGTFVGDAAQGILGGEGGQSLLGLIGGIFGRK